MLTGWKYRIVSAVGAAVLTVIATLLANHPVAQWLFTSYVPVFERLEVTVLSGRALTLAIVMSVGVVSGALVPLYKPRPRRALDTIALAQKRVIIGGLALSTIGFFEWSHRLPRATLVMLIGILLCVLPLWFVWTRRPPTHSSRCALVVGDDLAQIKSVVDETSLPLIGYLCPNSALIGNPDRDKEVTSILADGGSVVGDLSRLGGLGQLEMVVRQNDIDTVVLAFHQADRAEFFGALDTCYQHGIAAKVHREFADSVLVSPTRFGTLVDVEIAPWDLQDYLFKRGFDIAFALLGLVVLAPLMALIAVAVKLDSDGPIFYSQRRTAGFGETFTVHKFRTMHPEGDSAVPIDDEMNDRITGVGRLLRKTHLDELPQLWSILLGTMSVVGPRAAWTDEEALIEAEARTWRKRWFVKPGLTGLAQINDAKSTDPYVKLRYDLEYIRRQSFWFDLKIVTRQLWKIVEDVYAVLR